MRCVSSYRNARGKVVAIAGAFQGGPQKGRKQFVTRKRAANERVLPMVRAFLVVSAPQYIVVKKFNVGAIVEVSAGFAMLGAGPIDVAGDSFEGVGFGHAFCQKRGELLSPISESIIFWSAIECTDINGNKKVGLRIRKAVKFQGMLGEADNGKIVVINSL